METIVVGLWLVAVAVLLGPPLLGVHRSTWPLKSSRFPDVDGDADETAGRGTPTPVRQCRACGEAGQADFTYCRACLTPLPRPAEGPDAEGRDGHPAD